MTSSSKESPSSQHSCCHGDAPLEADFVFPCASEDRADSPDSDRKTGESRANSDDKPGTRLQFAVQGLDCHEEVDLLRGTVGKLPGIQRLSFDVFHGRMTVEFQLASLDEAKILAAIQQAGLQGQAIDLESSDADTGPVRSGGNRWMIPAFAAVWIVIGFISHWVIGGQFLEALHGEMPFKLIFAPAMLSYSIAIIVGGLIVFPRAWISIRARRADMHVLMTCAVIGAVSLGLWLEGAMVMWLFTIAMALEAMIVARARRAITSLLRLAPESATCRTAPNGAWETIDVKLIEPGMSVRIAPGERFPIDGKIEVGQTTAEESMLTGEAMPVEKAVGDNVMAGSINGMGAVEVQATCRAADSTLARIIRMVERAQTENSPTEQFVERFAAIYTPITMTLSLLTAVIPPLFFGGSWSVWIEHALVLLVVACPCALVIATPVAMVASIAASARRGILVKGARHLEAIGRVEAIAFDKTGTLTRSKLRVSALLPAAGTDEAELLSRAASLAARNQHPISQAILGYANERSCELLHVDESNVIAGKGTQGKIDGTRFWLGNQLLMLEPHPTFDVKTLSGDSPEPAATGQINSSGETIVYLCDKSRVWGALQLEDELRPTAPATLKRVRGMNVQHLVMLTGDRTDVAKHIASLVGIDEVHAEALPDTKLTQINRLREEYGTTAMVGDGINDGPALAAADVSIALGRQGTDVASETADIVLMNDRFERLPEIISRGRRTLRIISENVAFALAIKLFVVTLAWLGWGTIWMAVAADSGTSILVVLNALRLLHSGQSFEAPKVD